MGQSAAWTIVAEEIRRVSRRTLWRIMTFGVPAILIVLNLAMPAVREILGNDGSVAAIAGTAAGRSGLVDEARVSAPGPVRDSDMRRYGNRDDGLQALADGTINNLFVIPIDYLETGQVVWMHTSTGISASVSGESAAELVRDLLLDAALADHLAPELKARFFDPAEFESLVVDADGTTQQGGGGGGFLSTSYLFGILLMMSIFMGSGLLQESIGDEKENRMMEVLLTSVSPLGVMAGKVLAMGAVGLGQVLLWVASVAILGPRISAGIPQIGGLNVEPSLLIGMVAFFAAGYFLMAVVLAGIGAATTSYRESSQVALLVVIPSASPMMLFQLISGNPDGTLARVLSFIPFTAPFTMILRMGATDLPLWEVLASLAVVTVSGVGLLWVSARVFRAGLLLYGQRMSLGRVWAALQEAG